MDGSADGKEVSGGEIASSKCQSVTFVSGTSSSSTDENGKPKLQRIPTPFYEHRAQSGVRPEDSAGRKNPERKSLDPEEEEEEEDEVKDIEQTQNANCNPPKSSSGRRIHREFSMSRDDDDE